MGFFGTSVSARNTISDPTGTPADTTPPSFKAGMRSAIETGERRGERRNRTLRPVVISFNGGTLKAEGVLRDINAHGARIRISEPHGLPHEGVAEFGNERGEQIRQPLRIIWRRNREMGVKFR